MNKFKTLLKEIEGKKGVLVYIPDYLIYSNLRAILIKKDVKHVAFTEYSRWSEGENFKGDGTI